MFLKLVIRSLWSRRVTVLMTVLSLTISISLLLTIEHIRHEAKNSFVSSVSGTDLIVGARSGQLNLLLYSVFHVGNPTNNISWQTYQHIRQHRHIEWTVPVSLGDSHQGYRVVGTTEQFFSRYQYANRQPLQFAHGVAFDDVYEVVLGAQVARELNYQVGTELIISHGMGSTSFLHHADKPFIVSGILTLTGTPVDRSLYVSLQGIEAIHIDWQHGAPVPGQTISAEEALEQDLTPEAITAFLVGMKSRATSFVVQRQINEYRNEPLSAIIPGIALAELWQMLGTVENLLRLISLLVLVAALIGLITTLLASMQERQREIAILRATGARPRVVFLLIEVEVLMITLISLFLSVGLLLGTLAVAQGVLASRFGILLANSPLNMTTLTITGIVIGLALLLAVIPAALAYRRALSAGLIPRL